ncbi:DNA polymerase Y family protein, partial [Escherichia coli]|nr:DNA polymerase Y family protein [Escherichia coli]
ALWAGRRYSPFVSPDAPDGIWLDITGCAGLFGTEKALLKDLHRRVAASGRALQIAVADTAGCAHAVARHVPAGRPVTIEPGG